MTNLDSIFKSRDITLPTKVCQVKARHNSKPMRCSKRSFKRKVYSNTILPQETRKTSNRQLKFTPKITRKRTKPPKISRRKEIIKIRAETNERNYSKD